MEIAIKYLKKALENQIEDLRINKSMLNDKSNSIEMNIYFSEKIDETKKAIESIRKVITYLKTFDTKKDEFPEETGMYICKTHNCNENNIPFYAYYRSELKSFFGEDSEKPIDVLWKHIPVFNKA